MDQAGFERLKEVLVGLNVDISPRPTAKCPDVQDVSLSFNGAEPKPSRVTTAIARLAENNMLATIDGATNSPTFVIREALGNVGLVQLRDTSISEQSGGNSSEG